MNASTPSPKCSRAAVFAGLSLGLLIGLAGMAALLHIGSDVVAYAVWPAERVLTWVWAALAGLPVFCLFAGLKNITRNRISR